LVGPGQTHRIATVLPDAGPATLDGVQHHELFTGPNFVTNVPPALRRLYLKMS